MHRSLVLLAGCLLAAGPGYRIVVRMPGQQVEKQDALYLGFLMQEPRIKMWAYTEKEPKLKEQVWLAMDLQKLAFTLLFPAEQPVPWLGIEQASPEKPQLVAFQGSVQEILDFLDRMFTQLQQLKQFQQMQTPQEAPEEEPDQPPPEENTPENAPRLPEIRTSWKNEPGTTIAGCKTERLRIEVEVLPPEGEQEPAERLQILVDSCPEVQFQWIVEGFQRLQEKLEAWSAKWEDALQDEFFFPQLQKKDKRLQDALAYQEQIRKYLEEIRQQVPGFPYRVQLNHEELEQPLTLWEVVEAKAVTPDEKEFLPPSGARVVTLQEVLSGLQTMFSMMAMGAMSA